MERDGVSGLWGWVMLVGGVPLFVTAFLLNMWVINQLPWIELYELLDSSTPGFEAAPLLGALPLGVVALWSSACGVMQKRRTARKRVG